MEYLLQVIKAEKYERFFYDTSNRQIAAISFSKNLRWFQRKVQSMFPSCRQQSETAFLQSVSPLESNISQLERDNQRDTAVF